MRRRAFGLLGLFFWLAASGIGLAGRAAADELPTAAELRAKIAAAMGKVPDSLVERIAATTSAGLSSKLIVRSGDDFRETDGGGPLQRASGRYQKQSWHQNANGQIVLEQPDPPEVVPEAFTTTVTRVSAPVVAYVIARLNSAGSGTKEYVDPATSRVVRRDDIAPTQTTVTLYDDFRTVAGYTSAWHWTERDGHPENDGDYQVEAMQVRPVTTAEIEIAKPRRALVEFPAGKTIVDLPAKVIDNQFIVRVTIAGRGLDFILDSGAAGITLETDVAKELCLTAIARSSNAANAARYMEAEVVVPEMHVGELQMHDVAVTTIPRLAAEDAHMRVVGLLGFDFIAELGLKLDYEQGHVTAYALNGPFVFADSHAHVFPLDIRLGEQVPQTTLTINGAPGEHFIFDTGNATSLLIFDHFTRRFPRALADRGGGADRNIELSGAGGAVHTRPYQLDEIKLGDALRFTDFVAYRVNGNQYATGLDGALGAGFLQCFTVWLDYGDSQIVLVPNGLGRKVMR